MKTDTYLSIIRLVYRGLYGSAFRQAVEGRRIDPSQLHSSRFLGRQVDALLADVWREVGRILPPAELERYRKREFPPAEENFVKGWQERVTAEFDVINDAKLDELRAALKDKDPLVRSIAARALGIRSDKDSADALVDGAYAGDYYLGGDKIDLTHVAPLKRAKGYEIRG